VTLVVAGINAKNISSTRTSCSGFFSLITTSFRRQGFFQVQGCDALERGLPRKTHTAICSDALHALDSCPLAQVSLKVSCKMLKCSFVKWVL
jgi:hypothetical protein